MSDLCKRFSRTERQIQLIQNPRSRSHRVSHVYCPSQHFPGGFGEKLPMLQILQALINAVDADLPAKPILRAVREEPTRSKQSKMLLEITSDKRHTHYTLYKLDIHLHEHMTVACSIMQHTVSSWQQPAASTGVEHFSDGSPQVGRKQ